MLVAIVIAVTVLGGNEGEPDVALEEGSVYAEAA